MTLGAPLGEGVLHYAQPFYPYYLPQLQLLSGEDLYGVITLQAASLGLAAVLVYYLARTVFGRPTGLVALALMLGVLIPFELAWVARLLLSEALYFWLMPAAVLALLWLLARPGPARAIMAGLLLGLACVTRGPTLLYLPPAALLLWRGLRRAGLDARRALTLLALLGCGAGLIVGLVPLRNAIVAGKPALTASSGGVNLEKFHRPSSSVGLRNIDEDPFQRLIEVDRPTREVIEYVRQDPLGYLAACLPLAAYTLGVGSALNDLLDERPVQLHPGLLLLNGLYLLAIGLDPRARGLRAGFLHAFVGVHFLTMVVFAPYDYENRLALPLYLFVTPIAAAAPGRLWELVRAARGRSRPAGEPALEASGSGLDLAQT
jgi:4-amino-4-deoxy-L-arabinose transferase-like glycosyltransferase